MANKTNSEQIAALFDTLPENVQNEVALVMSLIAGVLATTASK